ncbi:MAG: RibD family protein [Alicyclobacillus sp.]|nr:RibD family protein [Alicyclobacillus sp.]
MIRPKIVVIMFASVDGRIATARGRNVVEWTALGLDGGANDVAHQLCDHLDCDGMISGSESVLVWGNHSVPLQTPTYWPKKPKAFIVIDGRGRIQWAQTDGLIVITREDAPLAYKEQLKMKGINFIEAGCGEHVDLSSALAALYSRGFRRLALTGGGAINGAFLRAGLVDEISIVIAPLVVGGVGVPTVFDGSGLASPDGITKVRLLKSSAVGDNSFWLHYEVLQPNFIMGA